MCGLTQGQRGSASWKTPSKHSCFAVEGHAMKVKVTTCHIVEDLFLMLKSLLRSCKENFWRREVKSR